MNMYPDKSGLGECGYDKYAHRDWLIKNHVPRYFKLLADELENSEWLAGMDSMSMADLCWYPTMCWLKNETFDGIHASFFEAYPRIGEWMGRVDDALQEDEIVESDFDDDEASDKKTD